MSGTNKYPAQYFTQLLDCPNTLTPHDVLVVNSTGTAIIEASPGSLVPPIIGTGVTGDIPIFSGTTPIFSDSGLNVTPVFEGLSISNLSGNINLSGSTNASVNAVNAITVIESTDSHVLNMDNNGVIITAGNGLTLTINAAGNLLIYANGASYVWPTAQASGVCTLSNDGSGNLSWVSSS